MQIKITSKGNFESTRKLMNNYSRVNPSARLKKCGDMYKKSLESNTPKDTGELSKGWDYEVSKTKSGNELVITNSSHDEWPDLIEGLEYGHGTGTGGYVPGTHFVRKSIDAIESDVSKQIEAVITDGE